MSFVQLAGRSGAKPFGWFASRAVVRSLALRLVAVTATTVMVFLVSALAGELLWALLAAAAVIALGE